ncbi:protein kinase domain-containing protein [Sorangium sp. So ce131]|uniref:serine/threonine-protein kinase n=1 Tax=Sorangium sp. So ce131 TaxID=3133282 RepID=UPI003F5EBFBD
MSSADSFDDASAEESAFAGLLRQIARAPSAQGLHEVAVAGSPAQGDVIAGKYKVEGVLGRGGMGLVVAATHLTLRQRVAIKLLLPGSALLPDAKERFLREGRLAAALRSEHCARVLDMGTLESGAPYLAMEYLQGADLGAVLRSRGGMPIAESVDLLLQAGEAIAEAHAHGIVHRDLKPSNLFLCTAADGSPLVKVLDFGLSRAAGEASITATHAVAGTPQFMAPEQIRGLKQADARADLWALGAILYAMIGGRLPFDGESPPAIIARVMTDPPRALRLLRPDVPAPLEAIILRCLEKDVSQRVQSVAELARGLAPFGAQGARLSVERIVKTLDRRGDGDGPALMARAPRAAEQPPRGSRGAPAAASAENRLCTIVFAGFSGTAALSERLDPDEVKAVVDAGVRALAACVERAGGAAAKLVGGRMMATFGVPRASDNDAERAVSAALEMRSIVESTPALRGFRRQLAVRIGINTGRVLAQDVGDPAREERAVFGDAVDVADHLQQHAADGAILIGSATYRNVIGRFNVDPSPPIAVEGRRDAIGAYRIVGHTTVRHPIPPSDFYDLETKFIGRTAEMQRITDVLDTAISEARSQLVTLVGPPGVGRSRMVGELVTSLAERPAYFFVMMAQGSVLGTGTSYGLAAALLRMRFQIHENDAPELVARKLRDGVRWLRGLAAGPPRSGEGAASGSAGGGHDGERTSDVPELPFEVLRELGSGHFDDTVREIATLLGARSGGASDGLALEREGAHAKSRVSAALARLLRLVAARAPIVILCDDAQWADDASLDLLDDLAVRMSDCPLFVLFSTRPELYERRPHWGEGKSAHVRVDVAPLARRHIEAMARDRLRRIDGLPRDFLDLLVDRAEGYPLILQETLHLLVDAGAIERRELGPWLLRDADLQTVALPATIEGILQARLDRLDPDARSVLKQAAVIGRTFWERAVDALRRDLSPDAPPEGAPGGGPAVVEPTGDVLARLRARQLIRTREASTFPGEREFVFAESATQEFAYKTLNQKLRRTAHRRVAAWLEARGPGAASAALVAVHYDRGGDLRRAIEAYGRAAAHAAALGQNQEALRHLERACSICDATVASALDTPRAALARLDEGGEEGRVADWHERVRLRLELGDVLRRMGELDRAERAYEEGRRLVVHVERRQASARHAGEPLRWEARVDFRQALTAWIRGSADRTRILVGRAIERATAAGAIEETPAMWAVLAALHRRSGDLDASRRAVAQGLRGCRAMVRRDDRWREHVSHLLGALGAVFLSQGRLAHAERCCRRAARAVDETMNLAAACIAQNTLAAVRYLRGDLAGARDTFAHALLLKERLGDLHELVIAHNNLAEVELRLGETAAALHHARQAVRFGERMHAEAALADSYKNLADASFAAGDRQAAIEAGLRALDRTGVGDGRIYLGDVMISLARICRATLAGDAALEAPAREAARRLIEAIDDVREGDLGSKADECRAMLAGMVELRG